MTDILPSQPIASTSSSSATVATDRPLCTICNHTYAIYTCPRCSFRTCSLPCSSTHKSRDACSGVRDKVKYVPMNEYGWGTMMDDYVFLEDVGRHVGDWGMEIGRGGFSMRSSERGRGRGRGRARGRGGSGGGNARTKQDVLKQQLELRDIDMELLPAGMERKKLNKSIWDFKKKTALLTIEFKFHAPPNPSAPSSQPREPPYTILIHKNRFETPLLILLQSKVAERFKMDQAVPPWVKCLVHSDPDDPDSFIPPQCLMAAQIDPRSGLRSHSAFYKLDPAHKLSVLLQDKPFVEFPTIEVWEEGDPAFVGTIVDTGGGVMKYADDGERMAKRRKLDVGAGKKAIEGLLGDYGSDEEEDGVMVMLGEYAGSDEDVDREDGGEDVEEDEGADVNLDPAALLELVRQAQAFDADAGHEDLVDWGDSDEDQAL